MIAVGVVSVVIVPTNIRTGCHTDQRRDTPMRVLTALCEEAEEHPGIRSGLHEQTVLIVDAVHGLE